LVELGLCVELGLFAGVREERSEVIQEVTMSGEYRLAKGTRIELNAGIGKLCALHEPKGDASRCQNEDSLAVFFQSIRFGGIGLGPRVGESLVDRSHGLR
jgi:hypothetical protein